jgi:hypothetical protein
MRRDDKGRYAKTGNAGNRADRDMDDDNRRPDHELDGQLLDRPPTTKLLFLISMLLWILTMVSPGFIREFDRHMAQRYCPGNSSLNLTSNAGLTPHSDATLR